METTYVEGFGTYEYEAEVLAEVLRDAAVGVDWLRKCVARRAGVSAWSLRKVRKADLAVMLADFRTADAKLIAATAPLTAEEAQTIGTAVAAVCSDLAEVAADMMRAMREDTSAASEPGTYEPIHEMPGTIRHEEELVPIRADMIRVGMVDRLGWVVMRRVTMHAADATLVGARMLGEDGKFHGRLVWSVADHDAVRYFTRASVWASRRIEAAKAQRERDRRVRMSMGAEIGHHARLVALGQREHGKREAVWDQDCFDPARARYYRKRGEGFVSAANSLVNTAD